MAGGHNPPPDCHTGGAFHERLRPFFWGVLDIELAEGTVTSEAPPRS